MTVDSIPLSLGSWEKIRRKLRSVEVLIWLLAPFLLTTASIAGAQQPTKIPRIGFVSGAGSANNPGPQVEAFRHGLRDLGYIEGKTIAIEYRYTEDNLERLAQLAAELVRLKVDGGSGNCPSHCGEASNQYNSDRRASYR
jgi:hypothetical protein